MFVFVSPNSLKSSWLYVESGYTFSKEAKVTPVGINGVDISEIGPPLSLLQGFNIDNHKKLNNIIAKINRNYNTEFEEAFTEDIYKKIFVPHKREDVESILNVISEIDLRLNLPTGEKFDLKEYLKSEGIKHSVERNTLYLHGAELSFNEDPFFGLNSRLNISPTKFFELEQNIEEIISMHNKPDENLSLDLIVSDEFVLRKDHQEISERLEDQITLAESHYCYKDLIFDFQSLSESFLEKYTKEEIIGISCKAEKFSFENVKSFLKLCISQNLILRKEVSY